MVDGSWIPIWPSRARAREANIRSVAEIAYLMSSFEKPRSKVVRTPAPGQPVVGGSGRFEVNVLDSRLGGGFAEVLSARAFHRADPQKHDLYLLIKRGGIGEHSVIGGLGIETAAAPGASAEPAEIRKPV